MLKVSRLNVIHWKTRISLKTCRKLYSKMCNYKWEFSQHRQPGLQESALTFLLLASDQRECEVIETMITDADKDVLYGDKDVICNLIECFSAIEKRGVQKSAFRLLQSLLYKN